MNIIIDINYFIFTRIVPEKRAVKRVRVTYLISKIYTNFRNFLCKKCDIRYYLISHGVYRRR